jgi:hypothetical protein
MKVTAFASILLLSLAGAITGGTAHPVLGPDDGSIQIVEIAQKAPPLFEKQLRDYPSARFRDVTGHYVDYDGDRYFYLCGYVNSKNAFGAYEGWTPFLFEEVYAPPHALELHVEGDFIDNDLIQQMCTNDDTKGHKHKDYSALLVYSNLRNSN